MNIFTILFVLLLIAWILGWTVFHVAGALIHILLGLAIVIMVIDFFQAARRPS